MARTQSSASATVNVGHALRTIGNPSRQLFWSLSVYWGLPLGQLTILPYPPCSLLVQSQNTPSCSGLRDPIGLERGSPDPVIWPSLSAPESVEPFGELPHPTMTVRTIIRHHSCPPLELP